MPAVNAALVAQVSPVPPSATLIELSREIEGSTIVRGEPTTVVCDVRHDARDVEVGDAFVARPGRHVDGATFVPQAEARGAAAILAERDVPGTLPLLRVPSAERALAFASSAVWRHPSFALDIVGITGTNGKTTTTWMLEQCLNRLARPTGLLGTVEHRFRSLHFPALHTTPEADDIARRLAGMREAGATDVVMEVSSHALTLSRVAAVRFRVAGLTNVTQDHLDFHGTFEAYAKSKMSLFLDHGPAGSVVNLDDAVGARIAEAIRCRTYSVRGDTAASVRVTHADIGHEGIRAEIATHRGPCRLRSALIGRHNLENLLLALGILLELDVPLADAEASLAQASAAPGRLERVRVGAADQPDVFVDYAHTPDALTNVLRALRGVTDRRIMCIFGCGGDRDPTKRAPMGRAVAEGADIAVLTTDNPRSEKPEAIVEMAEVGLRDAGMPRLALDEFAVATRGYTVVLDRRAAIAQTLARAGDDDVVLIAGKGHETYQEVLGVRTAFDDREEARTALSARAPAVKGAPR